LWGVDVADMDTDTHSLQGGWMGEQDKVKRSTHSLRYIRQMLEWGFTKEFIARDMGVNLSSLETRLRRAQVREQNDNQRQEPKASGSEPSSGSSEEIKG
jgi:hypothetical protein